MSVKMMVLDGKDIRSAEDLMKKIRELADRDPVQMAITKMRQLAEQNADEIKKEYDEIQRECDEICEKYFILNEDVKQFINRLFEVATDLFNKGMNGPDDKMKEIILFDFLKRFGHIQLDLKTEVGLNGHADMRKLFSTRISEVVGNAVIGPTGLSPEEREDHVNNLDRGYARRILNDSQWVMALCNSCFGIYSHIEYADCENSCQEENTTPENCVIYQSWLKYKDYLANQKGDA